MPLELTWGRVLRIWWAAFWRGLILANLFVGVIAGTAGITLVLLGHRDWGRSLWLSNSILLSFIPAGIVALRLALRTRYSGFRIVVLPPEPG